MRSPTKFIVDDNIKVSVLMNLLYVIVFETKIKDKRAKLMFCLVASSIFFVFAECKIIAFLSHQSDTSFMLFCKSFWTVAVFLSDAFSDVSSANISQFTESLVICKGRSLIKIQKRRGPRKEPWGIPYRIMPSVQYSPIEMREREKD